MKQIIAYEMQYTKDANTLPADNISMTPFHMKYYPQYERIYNECFYEMRKALDIRPYNVYSNAEQIKEKTNNIFLLLDQDRIIGSVGCYGAEIDDLIVNKLYQNQGYGKRLLLWAIRHIRTKSNAPVTLHVAEWNQNALKMYQACGFVITKTEHHEIISRPGRPS